jgi:hypothetical protein
MNSFEVDGNGDDIADPEIGKAPGQGSQSSVIAGLGQRHALVLSALDLQPGNVGIEMHQQRRAEILDEGDDAWERAHGRISRARDRQDFRANANGDRAPDIVGGRGCAIEKRGEPMKFATNRFAGS